MFISEKPKINRMKGLSPLISMVLVIAFGFAAMTIVLTVVNPLLDRAKDSGMVNEATQNMQLIDSAIKAVASESKGSKRTIAIKITEGVLRSDPGKDWVYFEYEPKTDYKIDGFSGDIKIESSPNFLEYFNQYSDNANANDTWTSVNGSWLTSSGRFLGTGGIAYHSVGNQVGFDISAKIVPSSAPHGQMYTIPGDPRNLVLYLPFDGNINDTYRIAYDYSAWKRNGTLLNGTAATCFTSSACPNWTVGKFGNATDFNDLRDGDFVNVTNISLSDFTVAAWIKHRVDSDGGSIVDNEVCGVVDDWGLQFYSSNKIVVQIGNSGGSDAFIYSASTITDNTWTHVAAVRSTTDGNVKIYINGVLDNTSSSPHNRVVGASDPGCDVYKNSIGIGTTGRTAALNGAGFNGTIDEVMIFNRAFTANEIAFLYESSAKKITASGEIPSIGEDANVTLVLSAPGSTYFDDIKLKTGPPKIRFVLPYSKIDIQDQIRFGPGDHNLVIFHNGTNTTNSRPLIRITE